jgi:hypothetical protein
MFRRYYFPIFYLIAFTHCITQTHSVSDRRYSAAEFRQHNLTNPISLYIPANGKHVKVFNRTILFDNEHVHYRIAYPPFHLKNKGTVVLLHSTSGTGIY